MKQKEDCKTSFYIAIITPDGKNNYKGRRDYKRINNARKAAVKLSMIYPCVMIRLEEKFNCGVECSGPFEEYKQGQKTHEHKDYLTEAGKIAYGYREDMTKDRERDFVKDCFDCYEKEGFAEKFNAIFDTYKEYHGKKFTVIGRSTEDDTDLTCLPMWKIRFEDGTETAAYPEEIIPSEIKNNQP